MPHDVLHELAAMSNRLAEPALDYVILGEGNTSARADQEQYQQAPRAVLMQNHGLIALGRTTGEVESITAMMVKTARALLGTFAAGGPAYMSQAAVDRIHSRPDEALRRRQLGLA